MTSEAAEGNLPVMADDRYDQPPVADQSRVICAHPVQSLSPPVLPAAGQRWAYGARKQEMAARRASRQSGQARTPFERHETALAYLPTTARPRNRPRSRRSDVGRMWRR